MSLAHHTISIHFVQTIIAATKRKGIDYKRALDASSLNEGILIKPEMRITPEQFSIFLLEIMKIADDEFMCMGSTPSRLGIFTLMAKQAVQCRDVRAVYYHFCHFYNLVSEAVNFDFETSKNETKIKVNLTNKDKDPNNTLVEFLLLLLHRFPSWLIGKKIPLKQITFACHEPKHKAEHLLMFPCPTLYNQKTNSLVLEAECLQLPVIQNKNTLRNYLQRTPLDWFKRQAYFQIYTRQVHDYLETSIEQTSSTMDEVSHALHVTSRTLRRKLTEEGTSFQQLKDDIRRDAAIHLLSQPSIPISQISNNLGFSDPAAFTRAFKLWTGVAPKFYRDI